MQNPQIPMGTWTHMDLGIQTSGGGGPRNNPPWISRDNCTLQVMLKKKKQDYAYNVNSRAYIWQIIHVLFVPHHSVLTWTYHVQGTILNALSKVTIQGQAGSQTQVARFKAKASNHYFARQKCRKLTSEITIYWFLSTRAMDLKVWSLD